MQASWRIYIKQVDITYTKPNDGTLKVVKSRYKYTVGSPTGASVSADAVKVLVHWFG